MPFFLDDQKMIPLKILVVLHMNSSFKLCQQNCINLLFMAGSSYVSPSFQAAAAKVAL